jgi:HEPN domain-containing protein
MDKKYKSPEEWVKQADYDLVTAKAMFKTGRYIYTVFMCHLSIEKALKGLYAQKFKDNPPKIHNLVYLCKKIGLNLPNGLIKFVTELNQVSIPTRYPDELKILLKEYNKQRSSNLIKSTEETLKWLKEKLEK